MAKHRATVQKSGMLAAPDDIKRVLGNFDDAKVLDILALRPTLLDVEEAAIWLSGDSDVFGAGQPLKRTAGDIVTILTADEEEERAR